MSEKTCPHCRARPAQAPRIEAPPHEDWEFYCTVCREAHGLVFTSIDEARDSIKRVTDRHVVATALRMEMKSRAGGTRMTFYRLCARRLKQLGSA